MTNKQAMASKTQIDRLGDRLKDVGVSEADLRLLDEYRRSFSEAYEFVVRTIRSELHREPTGRPAKSTTSVREKLRRETIRLSQIQDIAGCRLVVDGIVEQDELVLQLKALFDNTVVVDRRERPSNGYRAVHLIIFRDGKVVEVQVRTSLQHLWAEWSEKLSDLTDPEVKYGGGEEDLIALLLRATRLVTTEELLETNVANAEKQGFAAVRTSAGEVISVTEWKTRQASIKEEVLKLLHDFIDDSPKIVQDSK
jgi:ppGpp synthetase/RelA/SpoT-type nucleotidyltranferase